MPDLFEKCESTGGYFGPLRAANDAFFSHPVLEPWPGHRMTFQGREVIQWSINNYLGLAENEELKAVAAKAALTYGAGAPMGARIMTGTTEAHLALERGFAGFLEKEASVLFSFGYLGSMGTVASLAGPGDILIVDKLAHASILDGVFASGAKYRVFRHNDMDSLEAHLKAANLDRKGGVLIVTEGVFGMRGDLGNLPDICALKAKYDARVFVDDAHGMGVMGARGLGSGEHFGVQDQVDISFGTMAKAFASIGGVAATTRPVAEWIRYNARNQVYAKSLPMIYVEVLARTLELVAQGGDRRDRMWAVSRKLKAGIADLGFAIGDVPSPLCPVYVPSGDQQVGMAIIKGMRDQGVFITGVAYPVIPRGLVLFRLVPTASHTDEDIERTVEAFRNVRDALSLKLSA